MSTTYLEFRDSKSHKFWRMTLDGSKTVSTYGKIGSNGTSQEKDHGSAEKAEKFAIKKQKEKRKKGYDDANDNAASGAAPSKKNVAKKRKAAPEKKATAKKKAKKASAADGDLADGDTLRLEFHDGKSDKFWEITLNGNTTSTAYGKCDKDGMETEKSHASDEKAAKFAAKKIKEKRKKGYE